MSTIDPTTMAKTLVSAERAAKDQLLSNEQGSSISFEDYAIALVDEIETPAHRRQRFTVGY